MSTLKLALGRGYSEIASNSKVFLEYAIFFKVCFLKWQYLSTMFSFYWVYGQNYIFSLELVVSTSKVDIGGRKVGMNTLPLRSMDINQVLCRDQRLSESYIFLERR